MSRPTVLIAALIATLGVNAAVMAQSAPASTHVASQSTQQSARIDRPLVKPGDQNCLRHTGSLIPARKGECMPVVGRSYSGDELRGTGMQNNARALQMLDPSISVGH